MQDQWGHRAPLDQETTSSPEENLPIAEAESDESSLEIEQEIKRLKQKINNKSTKLATLLAQLNPHRLGADFMTNVRQMIAQENQLSKDNMDNSEIDKLNRVLDFLNNQIEQAKNTLSQKRKKRKPKPITFQAPEPKRPTTTWREPTPEEAAQIEKLIQQMGTQTIELDNSVTELIKKEPNNQMAQLLHPQNNAKFIHRSKQEANKKSPNQAITFLTRNLEVIKNNINFINQQLTRIAKQ